MTHTCHHRSGASSTIAIIISRFRFGGIWFRKTVVEAALPCRGKVHWWWPGHRVHATILPHRHLLRHVLAQVDPRLLGGVLVVLIVLSAPHMAMITLGGFLRVASSSSSSSSRERVAPVVSEKWWARRCAADFTNSSSTQHAAGLPRPQPWWR